MQKRSPSKKKLVEKNNTSSEQPVNMDEVVTRRILSEEMTTQRKEYERYMGSLVEDFQSKLDAITEIVVATAEDMTSIKDWIKEDHYNTHVIINN